MCLRRDSKSSRLPMAALRNLFLFGFGLSYTTFEYSGLKITEYAGEFVVSFNVKNTGSLIVSE